jgi:hypothetical protein
MGTCSQCRFWETPTGSADQNFGFDPERFRTCEHPKMVKTYLRDTPPYLDGAMVEHDEGWGIFTGPDFGCVNFARISVAS